MAYEKVNNLQGAKIGSFYRLNMHVMWKCFEMVTLYSKMKAMHRFSILR